MKIKLILPLEHIPDGSTVTKITGSNSYVVKDSIKIYGKGDIPILNIHGGKFLTEANKGYINFEPYEKEFMLVIDHEDAYELINEVVERKEVHK